MPACTELEHSTAFLFNNSRYLDALSKQHVHTCSLLYAAEFVSLDRGWRVSACSLGGQCTQAGPGARLSSAHPAPLPVHSTYMLCVCSSLNSMHTLVQEPTCSN